MGLENLKSVFNDLSENQISNPSKLTPHASRLDDIEYNLISDPNSGAGMLHGILTGGDQYVFELPNPPDKKPLTGRDTSDYNDILNHSTIDPKSGLHSPVSDMSKNSSNFQYYSPFPTLDSDFQNASIRLLSGQSLIEDDKHTFGTKGIHDQLIKIDKIQIRQEPSPLKDKNTPITFVSKIIGPYPTSSNKRIIDPNPIFTNEDKVKLRGDDLFQNLGANNRLGEGDFNWTSLYNANHTPIEERTPIDIGRVDKDGNAILINTLRSGMGSLGNLDIMGNSSGKLMNFRGFDRGNEPYIVKPIGSKDYTWGANRDGLNFNRAKDDTSRLLKFYGSGAGHAFMAKENVTNILIGNSTQPFRTDTLLLPPIPNPLQGNTGFLNFTNNFFQGLDSRVGSLRKLTTIEYSSRIQVGLPFGNLGDKFLKVLGVKTSIQEPTIKKSPFYDLSGAPGNYKGGPKSLSNPSGYRNTEYDDKIAAPGVIDPGVVEPDFWSPDEPDYKDKEIAPEGAGDFYVRILDLRDKSLLYFRGYVTGITENVNPSFTPTNYIGRSEPVYLYERAERDLSFNLRVYPNNEEHFSAMYQKIEKLTSLAYPEYLREKDNSSLTRMKAPFTELYMAHIGSRAKGQFGFIKSISYTVNESGDWDSKTLLPRLFDIAISYQILNKKPPSMPKVGAGRNTFYRLT